MTEEWRDIKGYEGAYQISSDGRVRSLTRTRTVVGPHGEYDRTDKGRIRKQHVNPQTGYLQVVLRGDGFYKTHFIHRMVCEAFHGCPPSDKHEVAHWDGCQTNNQSKNLRWATREENARDRCRHGTDNSGPRHPLSKLTREAVLEIRKAGSSALDAYFAKKYNVAKSTICNARTKMSWRKL